MGEQTSLDQLYEKAVHASAEAEGKPVQEFDRRHPFERAGLGKPPYKYGGTEEKVFKAGPVIKAGSSCDYCATAIRWCYWFTGSDGKRFKVGSDCALKAFKEAKDMRALRLIETEKSKHEKALRKARAEKNIGEGIAWLDQPEVKAVLGKLQHPQPYWAKEGKSYLDMVEWFLQNAGDSGQQKILRAAKKAYKDATGKAAEGPAGVVAPRRERPKVNLPPPPWTPPWKEGEVLAAIQVERRGKRPEVARVFAYYIGDFGDTPKLALEGPYDEAVIAGARKLSGWWEGGRREWHFNVPDADKADKVVALLKLYGAKGSVLDLVKR